MNATQNKVAYEVEVVNDSIIFIKDENGNRGKVFSLADVIFEHLERAGYDCNGAGLSFSKR